MCRKELFDQAYAVKRNIDGHQSLLFQWANDLINNWREKIREWSFVTMH